MGQVRKRNTHACDLLGVFVALASNQHHVGGCGLGNGLRDGDGAVGLGLRLWLVGLLIWAVGHFAAVWAAKRDPLFVEVGRRHLRIPGQLAV